jgi:hypothetical protein
VTRVFPQPTAEWKLVLEMVLEMAGRERTFPGQPQAIMGFAFKPRFEFLVI